MVLNRILVVMALILLCSNPLFADQVKEKDAVQAARSWLALVDHGKYAESWTYSAEYFKNAISKSKWNKTLTAVRKPLAGVISRKVILKQFAASLPGVPDGEYVVIQFKTSFKNKASSVETVTPSLEKDGVWRVSGYFIK